MGARPAPAGPSNGIPRSIWLLAGASLAVRLLLIDWYTAEYTDGILQIQLFTNPDLKFWPPVYAILLHALRPIAGDFVHAGRLVSIVAAALTVLPVYLLARRVFDHRAGLFAALLYSSSPIVNRWAIRMMNDPITILFFTTSSYFLISAVRGLAPERGTPRGGKRAREEAPPADPRAPDRTGRDLLLAFLFGGLAFASRYQGGTLLPPLLLVEAWYLRARKPGRGRAALHIAGGLAVFAAWLATRGLRGWFMLPGQEYSLGRSIALIAGNIGAYLWHLPYVLTPVVFLALLHGLLRPGWRTRAEKWFLILFGFVTAEILVIHGIYLAFQTRYLLPVLPHLFALAGAGIAALPRRRGLPAVALALAVLPSLGMSGAVLVLQRDTFGDIRRTAEAFARAPADANLYSDEIYKMEEFSGREVAPYAPGRPLRPGDRIALHTLYTNPDDGAARIGATYRLTVEMETTSEITPLLPDIVAEAPVTNRPEWAEYRFRRQTFRGVVLRVDGVRDPREDPFRAQPYIR